MPQPRQCDWDLLLVATADAVGNDVDFVSSAKKVNGGLRNANVTFDADDDAG